MAIDGIRGTWDPAFAPVAEALAELFTSGREQGASLCVSVDGIRVVDVACGHTDGTAERWFDSDTLVHTFSVAKPLVGACAMLAAERGLLDVDAPVVDYWPEFGAHGKDVATVGHMLSHQVGVPALRDELPMTMLFDVPRFAACLAREKPWWRPGEAHGEHALTYGHLVGELIRRVSGRSVGTWLREELAMPLGMDFHIGLPKTCTHRVADVTPFSARSLANWGGTPGTLHHRAMANPPGLLDAAAVNSAAWRTAEIPAVNGHGTARGICRFYEMILGGGRVDGVRVMSADTVNRWATPLCSGVDRVLDFETTWGLGPQVWGSRVGLGGIGGSEAFAHRDAGVAFAFATRTLDEFDRSDALVAALSQCLGGSLDASQDDAALHST